MKGLNQAVIVRLGERQVVSGGRASRYGEDGSIYTTSTYEN